MLNRKKLNEGLINGGGVPSAPGEIFLNDTISLTDEITVKPSQRLVNLEDTIYLCDKLGGDANSGAYATKIIYQSPYVYIITNEDPARLIKVDFSCSPPCDDVCWETYVLSISGDDLKNAKDFVIDDTWNYIYIACADGKLAKVDLLDPFTKERIIIDNPDNLTTIETFPSVKKTFMGTDSETAELYELDEQEAKLIPTNLTFLQRVTKKISTILAFIKGKLIQTNFVFLSSITKMIKTDLRFSPSSYTALTPLDREKFVVKIDNVSVTDVDLASIDIVHQIDERSTATFVLGRYFDKPDYTLDNTFSEITDQNEVKIYLNDVLIFEGSITNLNPQAEGEQITVTAESDNDWTKRFTKIDLPIATLNEQQHLYHAILQDIDILNPKADLGIITITNLSCQAGSTRLTTTGNQFDEDMVGESIEIISGTNFVLGTYEIVGFQNENNVILNRTPTIKEIGTNQRGEYLKDASGGVGRLSDDPPYFRGLKVDLGITEIERVVRFETFGLREHIAELLREGQFNTFPGITYFWFLDILDLGSPSSFSPILGETTNFRGFRTIDDIYVGTGLSALSGNLYEVYGVGYLTQKIYDNIELRNGYYYLGEFPYKEISVKNGSYISKWRWEDRPDGFYDVKGEWYDFRSYARRVANLEFEKMKNINGDLFPLTSANIDLTLDGFLYYGIKLLNRINIVETTQDGVYEDNHGFPLSVKTIRISSDNMNVSLSLDNSKSEYELERINDRYPDEPGVRPEEVVFRRPKWDLSRWGESQDTEGHRFFDTF